MKIDARMGKFNKARKMDVPITFPHFRRKTPSTAAEMKSDVGQR